MDEFADAVPLCADCGIGRLEARGTSERPWWECGACGWIALAV